MTENIGSMRCERCGYELPAEAERLRAVLSRTDPIAKVALS